MVHRFQISFFPRTLAIMIIISLCSRSQSLSRIAIRQLSSVGHIRSLQNLNCAASTTNSEWKPDYSAYKSDFRDLSDDQWKQLEALSLKLYDWNSKVNLVSRKDIESLIPNHIIPCLSMSLIRNFRKGETIIDVGTGGGLPGLPLAIACPNAQFTLVDSNSKKMMVVGDIAASLGLKNVRVICSRAEKVNESFDFMLGRAVSALPNFLSFSSHFVDGKSVVTSTAVNHKTEAGVTSGITVSSGLLYLKGGDFSDELEQASIAEHHKFAVSDMVPSVRSEKFVLYIPADEIVKNRARGLAAAALAAK